MSHSSKRFIPVLLFIGLFLLHSTAANAKEFDATLVWNQKVTLSTPVSGVISEVNANTGDFVNRGDVLVKLDDRYLTINLEKSRSDVLRWKKLFEETERELNRTLELYDRDLIATHDRDIAYIKLSEAEANYKNSQAIQKKAELDLEYSVIRAPFNGIIVNQLAKKGETVVSKLQARPLVIIAERGFMQARLLATDSELKMLSPGSKATITINNIDFQGEVKYISPEPTPSTDGKYEVYVLFSTDKSQPRVGLTVKLVIQ